MTYIDDAFPGAHDEAGQDHALDHQVRQVVENEAVLDGARLALVRVAHDVLRRAGGGANDVPLHASREARAAEAPEVARLERLEQAVDVAALDECAQGTVAPLASIRIGAQGHGFGCRLMMLRPRAGGHRRDEITDLLRRHSRQDHVVDGHGRRPVATSEARHVVDFRPGQPGRSFLGREQHFVGSAQVARHVAANPHLDRGRRRQAKVRIKARHAVELVQRDVNALR